MFHETISHFIYNGRGEDIGYPDIEGRGDMGLLDKLNAKLKTKQQELAAQQKELIGNFQPPPLPQLGAFSFSGIPCNKEGTVIVRYTGGNRYEEKQKFDCDKKDSPIAIDTNKGRFIW